MLARLMSIYPAQIGDFITPSYLESALESLAFNCLAIQEKTQDPQVDPGSKNLRRLAV